MLELKQRGYKIYAVEQAEGSISLEKFIATQDEKIAVIMGNEVEGVAADLLPLCDACIEIPQLGTKHSLNISVAAGIVLWKLCEPRFVQLGL
jgi:tRNA G18 (ribose-2'-O)-methylase SpoU